MKKRHIKFTLILFFAVLILSVSVFAAMFNPNAKVVFSGIQIKTVNDTTQGIINVNFENLDVTGVSFCLKYDTEFLELSDYESNEPIENKNGAYNTEHTYFKQNTANFPAGVFKEDKEPNIADPKTYPFVGIADASRGYFAMNFIPREPATMTGGDFGKYVGHDENSLYNQPYKILTSGVNGGVNVGSISFNIKNPERFAKLTQTELEEKIKIVAFYEMSGLVEQQDGVSITYLDEDGQLVFVSHNERYVGYDISLKPDLIGVEPQTREFTVMSYDIYKERSIGDSHELDLVDFLNEKASVVLLCYADGSKVPVTTKWEREHVDGAVTWDPKGGTYEIWQRYGEDDKMVFSVRVNVTPINLIGFDVDNRTITYIKGSEEFPEKVEDLNLPEKARFILDTNLLNGGVPEVELAYTELEHQGGGLPDGFGETTASYTFKGDLYFGEVTVGDRYPWLTTSDNWSVDVFRNVIADETVTQDDIPKQITARAVTDENGVMTIIVANDDGTPIDKDAKFEIRMPGGELIDTDRMGSERYQVEFEAVETEGTAQIKLKADIDREPKLAGAINLGERLGEFSIVLVKAFDLDGKHIEAKSPDALFASNPRLNIYIGPDTGTECYGGDNVYLFDYSLALSAMYPVRNSASLPTTITLPVSSHAVKTTYDGYGGSEPGGLKTVTVDEWLVTTDVEGNGVVKKFTGRLSDAVYTNYGSVSNQNDVYVTLVYYATNQTNQDEITITPSNFVFNKQQKGYDYDRLQTQSFVVTNTGHIDLHGLSAVISLANAEVGGADTGKTIEAFIETRSLPLLLPQGESASLDITTKHGLPTGKYTAEVAVYSNNVKLGTINIAFEVTDTPVFNITIEVNDPDFGSAKTKTGVTTAGAGEIVDIIAELNNSEDYNFVTWESDPEVALDNPNLAETRFTMPENDVKITAIIEETTGAKLRADELYVIKSDEELSAEKNNYIPLLDSAWKTVSFDPITREYYMVVPNDVEEVKLWFVLSKEEAIASEKEVTHTLYRDGDAYTPPVKQTVPEPNEGEPYYKSGGVTLQIGPDENRVELSFLYPNAQNPDTTRTYTIHIYRKIAANNDTSNLAVFNYGNSPYGRIMRDGSITDDSPETANGLTALEKKAAKKQAFKDNGYRFLQDDYVPDGTRYDMTYTEKAWNGERTADGYEWVGENYDLDDYALFVVNTSSFWDTGYIGLKNSIGQDVTEVGVAAKRIKIKVLQESKAELKTGNANDFLYVNSADEIINLETTGEITQLADKRIRPDIYWMEYIYKDYDGSDIIVKKPVVILYPAGDINISGSADEADALHIRERYIKGKDIANGATVDNYKSGAQIFRYRIVDANGDGYVNMLDGNEVEALINKEPKVGYINTTETETAPAVKQGGGGTGI